MGNIKDLQASIDAQRASISDFSAAMARKAMDNTVDMDEIKKDQATLQDMQARLDVLEDACKATYDDAAKRINPAPEKDSAPVSDRVKAMRKSNEYARAFCDYLASGMTVRQASASSKYKVLVDVMTETGGTPTGSDGGFLVPEDMDYQIRQQWKELDPLADLISQESVTAPTGWRTYDTEPAKGMPAVSEATAIDIAEEQPKFRRVTYSLVKYSDIIEVSNELLDDNIANLMGYLAKWFARRVVLTENSLITTKLQTLTTAYLGTSGQLGAIKTVLNKVLDPSVSRRATLLVNQTVFDVLDQLEDANERPLLQPDPTDATKYRVFGRPVRLVSDATLSGDDLYIGNFKDFATMFTKDGFEFASTNIGGNSWRKDTTEIRGMLRTDVEIIDSDAVARRTNGAE